MTTAPTGHPACPDCGAAIQTHWDWCHECGYDPENRKPEGWVSGRETRAAAGAPSPGVGSSTGLGGSPGAMAVARNPRGVPGGRRRRVGQVLQVVAVLLVAAVAVGVVAYVVLHGHNGPAEEPQATPEFASGMALILSSSDAGSQPIDLPDGLAGCTEAKLDPGDVTTISAWHASGDGGLDDGTEIRLYRAARSCDRTGLAQALNSQGNAFAEFGVSSIERQQCVNGRLIDFLASLDDQSATPLSQAQEQAGVIQAFQSCVPVNAALKAIFESPDSGATPDQAACLADQLSPSMTWTDLFGIDDPAIAARFKAAGQAAARNCPP